MVVSGSCSSHARGWRDRDSESSPDSCLRGRDIVPRLEQPAKGVSNGGDRAALALQRHKERGLAFASPLSGSERVFAMVPWRCWPGRRER